VRQIAKAASMLPNTAIGVMAAANRVLPGPGSKFPMQGRQVGLRPAVAAAVTLSERAAQRNNEV
jgi:hypothetical protein